MNKKFTIIISAAAVLLVVLLIVLAFLRSKPQTDNSFNQFASPTTYPNNRAAGSVGNTAGSVGNTGTKTSQQFPTITPLPKEKLDALLAVQKFLPYNSDSLAVDYSALTGKIYIQKKNGKADEELKKFLETNNLKTLYDKYPELFVVTKANLSQAIDKEEQAIDFPLEDSVPNITAAPTYPDQRKQNQTSSFNTLVKNLLTFKVPGAETQDVLVVTLPGSTNPSPADTAPTTGLPAKITYGKDTTNIPCAAGTDYGPADGYSNGVPTRIRVCRVNGFVVNSQVSKQFSDMTNAASAAGMSFVAPGASGSFRTMAGQINIYQNHCSDNRIVGSPPPYPKPPGQTISCPGGGAPGYSNHQMGLALDLGCDGKLIGDGVKGPRGYAIALQNRCFQWLQANASRYGFFEYGLGKASSRANKGYEGWHWSVNGN